MRTKRTVHATNRDRRTCSPLRPVRPDIGPALAAGGADEPRLDIRQPDIIAPASGAGRAVTPDALAPTFQTGGRDVCHGAAMNRLVIDRITSDTFEY